MRPWYKQPEIWSLLALILIPVGIVGTKLVISARERARIAALAPDVQAAYAAFLADASSQGLRIFTGRTQGSVAQTARNKAAGRSGVDVSWHDLDPPRAIDIQVKDAAGKAIASPKSASEIALYLRAVRIAESHGFRQIGFNADGSKRFLRSGAWDPYHIEFRGPYRTIAAAIEASDLKLA
jgi:hypothetical protein